MLPDTPTKPARGPGGRFLPREKAPKPKRTPTGGWLPIELAPKVRDEVLLTDGIQVGAGFWHDGSGCRCAMAGWFWEMDRGDLEVAENAENITHFRKMPWPPASAREVSE